MGKIVAFGDSNTYGYGLSNRELQAWPARVGEYLKMEHINYGIPGASNKEILWQIKEVESTLNQDDLIFIMWTWPHRSCVIREDHIQQLNLGTSELYYKHFENEANSFWESRLYVEHANLLLDNFKLYNLFYDKVIRVILSNSTRGTNIDNVMYSRGVTREELGNDNLHLGEKPHDEFARMLSSKVAPKKGLL